jgi:cystathionine beta-lyase/cystathionine gamma-synthase
MSGSGGGMARRLIKGLDTKLIHAGEPEPLIGGAVAMPIFQSSTYEYAGQTSYHDLGYIRLSNTPNHAVLHAKLASLENEEGALVAGRAFWDTCRDSIRSPPTEAIARLQ